MVSFCQRLPHPRFGASAVWCGFMVLLTSADALAQVLPGYRMRFPTGVPVGSSVRPPRLTVTLPSPAAGSFRRQFFSPYQFLDAYPFGSYGYGYPDDSMGGYSADSVPVRYVDPADYATEVKPAAKVQTLDDSAVVGKLQVTEETVGSKKVVRLTWRDKGVGATQVAFFLADANKTVLSAQTFRSPPFTAVFEPPPAMAFTGMTVVMPGGSLVTQYVPYKLPSGKAVRE